MFDKDIDRELLQKHLVMLKEYLKLAAVVKAIANTNDYLKLSLIKIVVID
jgi:hypothetical protein